MKVRKDFENNGYVILKNLIHDDLVDKVLDSLEQFKNKKTIYFTQSTHTWVSSNKVTEEGFLIDSIQTPTKQYFCGDLKTTIKNLLSSEKISEILTQISGYKYFVNWQNMLFDKSTGTTDHADTWYLDTLPRGKMIACWIALENINKSAGRFFVCPKSHKLDISKITSSQIKNHYDYAKLIMSFMEKEGIKRYAPNLKKGDVLFWHPFTIHGSYNQTNKNFSRKSITAHYHPVGLARADVEEKPEDIKKYISRMRKSSNPYISFDNSDPTEFNFITLSLTKYFIKKYLFRKNMKSECLMDRKEVLK